MVPRTIWFHYDFIWFHIWHCLASLKVAYDFVSNHMISYMILMSVLNVIYDFICRRYDFIYDIDERPESRTWFETESYDIIYDYWTSLKIKQARHWKKMICVPVSGNNSKIRGGRLCFPLLLVHHKVYKYKVKYKHKS